MTTIRYWLAGMGLALAGGFIVVASFAWAPAVAGDIAFAVAIGVTVAALAMAADVVLSARPGFLAAPIVAALIGGWTIVAMNVFSVSTERWLAFASGCAIVVSAVGALVAHEATRERVVHSLEPARPAERRDLGYETTHHDDRTPAAA